MTASADFHAELSDLLRITQRDDLKEAFEIMSARFDLPINELVERALWDYVAKSWVDPLDDDKLLYGTEEAKKNVLEGGIGFLTDHDNNEASLHRQPSLFDVAKECDLEKVPDIIAAIDHDLPILRGKAEELDGDRDETRMHYQVMATIRRYESLRVFLKKRLDEESEEAE